MSGWKKFKALPRAEQRVFLQACCLLPLLAGALRLLGLVRCQRMMAARWPATYSARTPDLPGLQRLGAAVNAAAYHGLYRASCLERSLVLWWLLRRAGISTELRIGVGRNGSEFNAHAWVECGGAVLNDSPQVAAQYAPYGDAFPVP